MCVSHKAGNVDEQLYNQHITKKNKARDSSDDYSKSSDKSTGGRVFTMDLQSILLCPILRAWMFDICLIEAIRAGSTIAVYTTVILF